MDNVTGKVFLITGAASGIGAGVARSVLEHGAKHVAILDVNVKEGEALEAAINERHGARRARFMKCDVTRAEELDAAFEETTREFHQIDVVINNAGIMNDRANMYMKEIAVNVVALVTSSLKAYSLMRMDEGGKGGTIVNISSIVGLSQSPYLPIYSATKSAVLQFSNCLGHDMNYQRTGVRVLTICFGQTKTNLIQNLSISHDSENDESLKAASQRFPCQSVESAVKGLIAALDKGEAGSTWLVTSNKPAKEITDKVKKSFEILSEGILDK